MPLLLHRCGDIGPKIGFNTMDNGFLILDQVRIPRGNMAMRHQQVDRDGVYTSTGSKEGSKIAYISMMQASDAQWHDACFMIRTATLNMFRAWGQGAARFTRSESLAPIPNRRSLFLFGFC